MQHHFCCVFWTHQLAVMSWFASLQSWIHSCHCSQELLLLSAACHCYIAELVHPLFHFALGKVAMLPEASSKLHACSQDPRTLHLACGRWLAGLQKPAIILFEATLSMRLASLSSFLFANLRWDGQESAAFRGKIAIPFTAHEAWQCSNFKRASSSSMRILLVTSLVRKTYNWFQSSSVVQNTCKGHNTTTDLNGNSKTISSDQ